ncbi:nucleoside hydrolase [Dermabacteraceae bacterium P13138]
MLPVFLDCDTGIDDSVALAYLMAVTADPGREETLVGVACTGGNVPTKQVMRNVLGWLTLGQQDNIPLSLGSPHPIAGTLMTCEDTHGPAGVGNAELPQIALPDSPQDAAEHWIEQSLRYPGQLIGIVIGPTTSLARAIRRDPTLPSRLASLTIMGGSLFHRGNTLPTTEWNVAVDPEALQIVLDACRENSLIPCLAPLDATEQVEMHPHHLEEIIRASGGGRFIKQLGNALEYYFAFHEQDGLGYLAHLHDPFVVAHALTGRFAKRTRLPVAVELVGTLTRGQVVADPLGRWGKAPNVDVLTEADPEEFFAHLNATLSVWAKGLSAGCSGGQAASAHPCGYVPPTASREETAP